MSQKFMAHVCQDELKAGYRLAVGFGLKLHSFIHSFQVVILLSLSHTLLAVLFGSMCNGLGCTPYHVQRTSPQDKKLCTSWDISHMQELAKCEGQHRALCHSNQSHDNTYDENSWQDCLVQNPSVREECLSDTPRVY